MRDRRRVRYLAATVTVPALCVCGCSQAKNGSPATPKGTLSPSAGQPSLVHLRPGKRVTLLNGLSLAIPPGSSGELADNPLVGPPEVCLVNGVQRPGAPRLGITIDCCTDQYRLQHYAHPEAKSALIARSVDNTVEVRWFKAVERSGDNDSVLLILTCLPDRLEGVLTEFQFKSPITTPKAAWQEAERLWTLLSIEGAQLPPFSGS